ncbi:T9SS type A sorting domain-containing protein [uncultured Aquimarina sp.]|uniref:T9SS type A sorting domain-containing protein n=1 Tax=uncultured Aquimarina sp. TaxID=575652 RepID=UPI00344F9CFD
MEEINNKSEASIIISDIQGKVIHKESFSNSNFELNTSNIKSGIYIITIENGQNLYTRKVIFE